MTLDYSTPSKVRETLDFLKTAADSWLLENQGMIIYQATTLTKEGVASVKKDGIRNATGVMQQPGLSTFLKRHGVAIDTVNLVVDVDGHKYELSNYSERSATNLKVQFGADYGQIWGFASPCPKDQFSYNGTITKWPELIGRICDFLGDVHLPEKVSELENDWCKESTFYWLRAEVSLMDIEELKDEFTEMTGANLVSFGEAIRADVDQDTPSKLNCERGMVKLKRRVDRLNPGHVKFFDGDLQEMENEALK
ncbi:hypothetical protein [Lacticaseibacillus kribbianus]|uniref:hypothetical protein n=1 Tax=Lacticaseibacillus kribbianus TaxID=2926292 RepID=UPI001CD455D3|nr:hypothetical protein [Lacticaseibacillus kribbianus]